MTATPSGSGELPILRLHGNASERGRLHGELARTSIDRNIDVYTTWFDEYASMTWDAARGHARAFQEALTATAPELDAEIRGIADGSGRDPLDIVVLNARTEIAYGASGMMDVAFCECTSVAAEPVATRDGHLLIGENWDWLPEVLANTVLCHIVLPDGLELLTFTEAGMLAKFGVNSAGIALCDNLLASNRNVIGHTFHTLARLVLESRTLTEAMKTVTGAQRAGSGNFLMASANSGEIVDLEWAPGDFSVIQNQRGVLAHANNFTRDLDGIRDRAKILPSASPGTYLRTTRAQRYLEERHGQHDMEGLQELFRDHRESPEAICRHQTGADHEDVFGQTNISVVFDLTAEELCWTYGPPCRADYQRMRFPWADDDVTR